MHTIKLHLEVKYMLALIMAVCIQTINAQNIATEYHELWNTANELYETILGYRQKEVPLTASQLSSNASDYDEGQHLEYLLDGNPATFWHSDWHDIVKDTHYIQIDLDEPLSGDIALYAMRRQTANHHPTLIGFLASNDGWVWDELDAVQLGNPYSGAETVSPVITLDKEYSYLRITLLDNAEHTIFGHFAEIRLLNIEVFGENRKDEYGITFEYFEKELLAGKDARDWDITQNMLDGLKSAYDMMLAEMSGESEYAEQYRKLWNEANETYKSLSGFTIGEIIPLKKGMLSSNASDRDEGRDIDYLLDDNPYTFWHSDWHEQVTEPHYIQVNLEEPLAGGIVFYALRRQTVNDHPTVLTCLGSNDEEEWTELGTMSLPNASSGMEAMSSPVSLGDEAYSYLRFVITETSGGRIFGHFAEVRLYQAEIFGEDNRAQLNYVLPELEKQLELGAATPDKRITSAMLADLQKAYNALLLEKERLDNGLPPSFVRQYTDIPTLVVNTLDGNDITSKTEWKYAKMWRIEGDSIAVYDSLKIRGRGNSTWGMAKKPYRIKFDSKEKFLGKGYAKAKNWTLMANYADKTLLRNATASFIGRQLGQPFVPAAEFADFVLNGEFLGSYQISDQIEVHKKRVEITEQEDVPTEESDISGGYLIEFDGGAGSESVWVRSDMGQPVTIKSPDDDVITWEQKEYVRQFINDYESRLFSDDYTDPELGYRAVTDSATLISWFLSTEYTGNVDGYYSTYAYKDQGDDHLCWGPLWDYDIAFDNCNRIGLVTQKLMMNDGYTSGQMTNYVKRMYSDQWFRNAAGRAWHKAVLRDSLVERTMAYVDSMALVIDQSQRLNFQKWPIDQHVYNEIVLFSTYQEGVDFLKKFLVEHAQYLSETFPNPEGITPPEPAPSNPLGLDRDKLYYIYNVGSNNIIDINGDEASNVCMWAPTAERAESQMWEIIPARGDYYRIVLHGSGLAITDVAPFQDGEYTRGKNIALLPIDEEERRQMWEFVPTADYYSIANAETNLAWNNSNGSTDNGNPVISWTNNADNAKKTTRQWYPEPVGDDIMDGIASAGSGDVEFRITYDPVSQHVILRLPADAASQSGEICVYDIQGQLQGRGNAQSPISVSHLPAGVYVVGWNVQGHRRSIKFVKR